MVRAAVSVIRENKRYFRLRPAQYMAEGRGSINWFDSGEEVSYKENAQK
jgi:hypothetical protein